MSSSEREEECVGVEQQCVPGTGGTEHAGRDSSLSRQAVAETETAVVGRIETTGTDTEVDVVGTSAGPSPVRVGSGLGTRRVALGVKTVPSSARVETEDAVAASGVDAATGPSPAHVAAASGTSGVKVSSFHPVVSSDDLSSSGRSPRS